MSKVKVTLFVRDSDSISALFSEEDLNNLAKDFDDFAVLGPGAWHATIAAILLSSRKDQEFFLEGESILHVRKSGDIIGFTIEPPKKATMPAAMARSGPRQAPSNVPNDTAPLVEGSRIGIVFFAIVAALAIAVIVFLQMRGG